MKLLLVLALCFLATAAARDVPERKQQGNLPHYSASFCSSLARMVLDFRKRRQHENFSDKVPAFAFQPTFIACDLDKNLELCEQHPG